MSYKFERPELKFRSWDGKSMSYSEEFTSLHAFFGYHEDEEMMQWTGLKDKNGKDIYEGDILEFADKWEWYRGTWSAKLHFASSQKHYASLLAEYNALPTHKRIVNAMSYGDGEDFSVGDLRSGYLINIGNVFENPDLIPQ